MDAPDSTNIQQPNRNVSRGGGGLGVGAAEGERGAKPRESNRKNQAHNQMLIYFHQVPFSLTEVMDLQAQEAYGAPSPLISEFWLSSLEGRG